MVRLISLMLVLSLPVVPATGQRVGQQVPTNFVMRTLGGDTTSLATWTGRARVVNLWASWCTPCRVELPTLGALADSLAGDGIVVVALALDRAAPVRRFLATLTDRPPRVLLEDAPLPRRWGTWALPVTIVLDGDDRILHVHHGAARWDDPRVVASIRALVARPPGPRGGDDGP